MPEALPDTSLALEQPVKEKGCVRALMANTKLRIALAFGVTVGAADTYVALCRTSQPSRISASDALQAYPEMLTKESSVEEVMHACATVEDFQDFLRQHVTHRDAEGVWPFIVDYRESPDDLQEDGWVGCCNNIGELAATWAYRHGGKPYVVSLCPAEMEDTCEESWHQIVVCETSRGLIIFNDTDVVRWSGSLASYIEEKQKGKEIFGIGGIFEWRKVRGPHAKFLQHVIDAVEEEEMEEADLPVRSPRRPPQPLV